MSAEEAQTLGRKEFWDERYAKVDEDKQTHEWFRAFNALEPFFTKHLFAPRKAETQPRILHLGSGDSVSISYARLGESGTLFTSFLHESTNSGTFYLQSFASFVQAAYISAHFLHHKTDHLLDYSIRPAFTRLQQPNMC
jgi:hypothetical protein